MIAEWQLDRWFSYVNTLQLLYIAAYFEHFLYLCMIYCWFTSCAYLWCYIDKLLSILQQFYHHCPSVCFCSLW